MLRKQNPEDSTEIDWIRQRIADGLESLIASYRYAKVSDTEPDEFAATLPSAYRSGLSECDIRWLIANGYASHLIELTLVGDDERSFRSGGALFTDQSCIALTRNGFDFAVELQSESYSSDSRKIAAAPHSEPRSHSLSQSTPFWDIDRQELWYGDQLIKRYRLPSPNQTAILSAFEEDDWPARIDDPLPPKVDQDPKRRLHDTIRNLNRSHQRALIRFAGDGSGQGVLWERL